MTHSLPLLTKKLQHHSLDEPVHNNSKVTSEDRDSGTESDDEQTFEEIDFAPKKVANTKNVQKPAAHSPFSKMILAAVRALKDKKGSSRRKTSEMSSEVSSGCSVRSRPTSQTSTDTVICDDLPGGVESPDMPPPCSNSQRRSGARPLHNYQLRSPSTRCSSPPGASPVPAPPSIDDDDFDPVGHHSSEEELETLTGPWSRENGPQTEKRKWSQARLSLTDSGSSDDEVYVLTTRPPVEFRTSPPLEAHKPLRSKSPPAKVLSVPPQRQGNVPKEGPGLLTATGIINGTKGELSTRASSPRKRHRHTQRPHRPCLDFEKMQQMKSRAVTQWRNGGELSLSFF